jgi:hypothetical protein
MLSFFCFLNNLKVKPIRDHYDGHIACISTDAKGG